LKVRQKLSVTTREMMVVVVERSVMAMTVINHVFVYFDTNTQQPNGEIQSTRPA
jgi:hypothetical protein